MTGWEGIIGELVEEGECAREAVAHLTIFSHTSQLIPGFYLTRCLVESA